MSDAFLLDEPELEFRFGQALTDPHDGLALFGPFDADAPSQPRSLAYGVVGTKEGLGLFNAFARCLRGPIVADRVLFKHDIWPPYPGFDVAFNAELPDEPVWSREIDADALSKAVRIGDQHDRAHAVVDAYLREIAIAKQKDERVAVVFCIVPEEVHRYCRPQSVVAAKDASTRPLSAKARALAFGGQQDMLDSEFLERRDYSVDFRRRLKARVMEHECPVQIVRETTLRLSDENTNPLERGLTPLSDRAWNLTTTAYYKAGGKPWRLKTARPGVCYVGLAFRRREHSSRSRTAVCAAQMFLDSGDGVVFKGEYGPWYSKNTGSLHLTPDDARALLSGVISTYQQLDGRPLREVFLHSRSEIDESEFSGYSEAVPEGVKLVGIRVKSEGSGGIKLFREGTRPVIRGTTWQIADNTSLLWGSGFVPRHKQYLGAEVPVPLRIDIQHGDADIMCVTSDILALTKLNFNACRYGDAEPVTIGFSDAVGEILVSNPSTEKAQPHFRYYI